MSRIRKDVHITTGQPTTNSKLHAYSSLSIYHLCILDPHRTSWCSREMHSKPANFMNLVFVKCISHGKSNMSCIDKVDGKWKVLIIDWFEIFTNIYKSTCFLSFTFARENKTKVGPSPASMLIHIFWVPIYLSIMRIILPY